MYLSSFICTLFVSLSYNWLLQLLMTKCMIGNVSEDKKLERLVLYQTNTNLCKSCEAVRCFIFRFSWKFTNCFIGLLYFNRRYLITNTCYTIPNIISKIAHSSLSLINKFSIITWKCFKGGVRIIQNIVKKVPSHITFESKH